MIPKALIALAAVACFAYVPLVPAQAAKSASDSKATPAQSAPAANPAGKPQIPSTASTPTPAPPAAADASATSAPRTDCFGGNCEAPAPRIAIATPAPAPAPWLWQERITWGANIVLVILGYAGVMMGLSLLRKIERQTRYAEETAQAAAETARAALKQAESFDRAERPWVLMTVRQAQNIENGFAVIATNRGRGPARIVSMIDEVVCAPDESALDPEPVFKGEQKPPQSAIILLPGESTDIARFSRSDVEQVSGSEERLKRIEKWEEKLYLYGKVAYCDLLDRDQSRMFESSWFCWYIHGRQKSGMVMAGPPSYNRHS